MRCLLLPSCSCAGFLPSRYPIASVPSERGFYAPSSGAESSHPATIQLAAVRDACIFFVLYSKLRLQSRVEGGLK